MEDLETQVWEKMGDIMKSKTEMTTLLKELSDAKLDIPVHEQKVTYLKEKAQLTKAMLDRGERILRAVNDGKAFERKKQGLLSRDVRGMLADVVLLSAALTYGSGCPEEARAKLVYEELRMKLECQIGVVGKMEPPWTIVGSLLGANGSSRSLLAEWNLDEADLKNQHLCDNLGIASGHVANGKWPLFLDPHGQATRWINSLAGEDTNVSKLPNHLGAGLVQVYF